MLVNKLLSTFIPSFNIKYNLAPLALASMALLNVLSFSLSSVIKTNTGVLFSIKAIGPCFNSPAG